jgi:hypothetical protein
MTEKHSNFNQTFNVKFNLGFVLRVTPEDLQQIKTFIESLPNVIIVHSQVSGNRLYIKEEGKT